MGSKYLTESQLDTMIKIINADNGSIWNRRNKIYEEFGIDILDSGDTLSTIRSAEYIRAYDSSYNPNFHRNGEDAKSNTGDIEQKTTRVDLLTPKGKPKKQPYNAQWTFHAVANYEERYIFVAMDKKTWTPARIYDITKKANVKIIVDNLEEQRQKFLSKGRDPSKIKNDRIGITEIFIRNNISTTETEHKGCVIYRD